MLCRYQTQTVPPATRADHQIALWQYVYEEDRHRSIFSNFRDISTKQPHSAIIHPPFGVMIDEFLKITKGCEYRHYRALLTLWAPARIRANGRLY